ncbi:tetratricopeptide repeat protein [Ichthyenterobacterium magnum]|uniref:Tetratricopeptide repeat protein n=1 Tax=Ichthyenterobacterium magnum TaxID=1230530 RepID=A0A420DWM1_9FLAO|nr:tetratricopeptide repeat protein [Ichthyenterobacterium magnum]RKE98616.1 tetratricopeptide repeat protein [Ichthyenterobacterium magnum]
MQRFLLYLCLLYFTFSFSQSEQLADDYFKRGEFEKALIAYQKLNSKKGSSKNLTKIIKTLQQLERYDEAQELLLKRMAISRYPGLLVELGYNYQLKDSLELANKYYNEAILKVDEKPVYTFNIARKFEELSLLDNAIIVYKKGMELNPEKNFSIQLARIYGEQGNIEQMFSNYVNYIEFKPDFINNAKRAFSDFISENKDNENNIFLKKILLKKLQTQPDPYWYELLSWLFVQEKAYNKSFTQEKALYKRNPESLSRIIELAITAVDKKEYETANTIFNYIIDNSQNIKTVLLAHQYLLDIEIINATKKQFNDIDKKYLALFNQYGTYEQTLALQIAYGHFLAFHLHKPKEASEFLKKTLKLETSAFQEATVKLKLADILVYQEKFNEALIYYSQIQANLKNSTISQEARFKVAKTSYYKGDFEWAESQLKILKASTSQLIANDALDLKLLISDNKYEDTLHVALKLYAKADLMAFQNKTEDAILLLDKILTEHKGESIEDQALLKQAQLFEKQKQYTKAASNYQYIIANYRVEILADDAHYFLAELYNTQLGEPEKAKPLYENIIFQHEDSIYFVEARKKYRMLRGDTIN